MGRESERERAGVKFFHNEASFTVYRYYIYIVYMHYDALVCTHMAMRAEWKRGSHSLSYRRAGPCEMRGPCEVLVSRSLPFVLVRICALKRDVCESVHGLATAWRGNVLAFACFLLCALPSGIFIQAGTVHSPYSASSKESSGVSVCRSPFSLLRRFCNQLRV